MLHPSVPLQRKRRREKISTKRQKSEYFSKVLPSAEAAGIVQPGPRAKSGKRPRAGGAQDAGEAADRAGSPTPSFPVAADSSPEPQSAPSAPAVKYDPLFKAKRAAEQRAAQALARKEAAAAAEVERAKRLKARRSKARKYKERTDRGQPVMKHRIKDLLGKIKARS